MANLSEGVTTSRKRQAIVDPFYSSTSMIVISAKINGCSESDMIQLLINVHYAAFDSWHIVPTLVYSLFGQLLRWYLYIKGDVQGTFLYGKTYRTLQPQCPLTKFSYNEGEFGC